jgi:hypothetical protein
MEHAAPLITTGGVAPIVGANKRHQSGTNAADQHRDRRQA